MKKKLIIAVALIFVATVAVLATKGRLIDLLPEAGTGPLETSKGAISQNSFTPEETEAETIPETKAEETTALPETTIPETEPETEPVTEAPVTETPETEPITVDNVPPASPAHFDSSLFIGDSRTVGLRDYADLGNATVFATQGMNVFRIAKENVDVPGHGATSLEGILNAKKYEKIYLMLGINEIGYNAKAVINKYTEIVNMIKAAQPDAKIYIQANLHITAERSDSDTVYNNARLNVLNDGMAALANGENIIYMDANVIFDDANGCLDKTYASDDFHLFSKYYSIWADWIALNS